MEIKVCVGSSCHLKGSRDIVELLQSKIEELGLKDSVELVGSFCTGDCNRVGVTIQVDEETFTGITTENFKDFFAENVLGKIERK